jgi:hypothetical protein
MELANQQAAGDVTLPNGEHEPEATSPSWSSTFDTEGPRLQTSLRRFVRSLA